MEIHKSRWSPLHQDSCHVNPQTISQPLSALSLRCLYAVAGVLVASSSSRGVEGAPLQQPVDDVAARLPVLVSEQGVHEGVARRLAVGQALGDDPPVRVDRHGRK